MKLAIIGSRGYPSFYGGFETLVRHLAPYLCTNSIDVIVYSRKGAIDKAVPNQDERVRSVVTPGLEKKSLSTITHGLTATIHAIYSRCDTAFVMNVANGFWLPLLRAAKIRTVVNVDGIEWERAKWNRFAKLIFRLGARMTARYADELVFDAEAIASYWQDNFGRTGTYIPYGSSEASQSTSITTSIPNLPKRFVLLVARFVPENTVNEFFDAIPMISKDIGVVIVGSAGYGGELEERARALHDNNEIIWLGHVSNDEILFGLWNECTVYFHGHSVGGTNPALVQAMRLGAAIVARDTVYNREVLKDCGEFVSPDKVDIANTILAIAHDEDRCASLKLHARQRAQDRFTWEKINSAYLKVLTK